MKVNIPVFLFLAFGLLAAPAPVFPWEGSLFDLFEISNSSRAAAMGGLHAALADDATVLFSNPAGLRSVDRQITISECMLSFYESALEFAAEGFAGAPSPGGVRRGTFSLWGPLAFSYVGNGRGFGIYSSSNIFASAWGPIPAGQERLEVNLVLIGGWAFRIPLPERWQSSLDLGVAPVGFATARGASNTDIRQVFQSTATLAELLANSGSSYSVVGAGIEFGLLYSFKNRLSFGISGRNLALEQIRSYASIPDLIGGGLSSSSWNVLPLDLSVGILFRPPLGRLGWIVNDLLVAADYHNIFDFVTYPDGATNPLLHIGVGLELKLLEIVSLRAGYYQCLPSAGIGLDLSLFSLDLAYFGRELSKQPGGYPVSCYSIGVRFSY